ncbi:MAG: hypothetical protein HY426_02530 [Candidatus Levybacteria bacterium]|nr:hypothetical protein [Candidatus Levybacteria bacterium]
MQRKFPKPRKKLIGQSEMERFLPTIGFKPNKIFQEWRDASSSCWIASRIVSLK